jgi:hypothetical protein
MAIQRRVSRFRRQPWSWGGEYADGLYVGEENSFSITVAPWANRPANTLIQYNLLGPAGGFRQMFNNTTPPDGYTFSGLAPDTTYLLEITYMNIEQVTSAPIGTGPSATNTLFFNVGASSITRMGVHTVPEPNVVFLTIAGIGAWGLTRFVRKQKAKPVN